MANLNFNKIILGGRLTGDPELRQTPNGIPVASFSVAVSRRNRSQDQQPQQNAAAGQQQQPTADFFNCTAWRQQAEFISRYFRKGSSILLTGTLQNRSWTDQQGQKRFTTDVIVDEVQFVDSKSENSMNAGTQQYQSAPPVSNSNYNVPSYASDNDEAAKFEDLQSDDDLPF